MHARSNSTKSNAHSTHAGWPHDGEDDRDGDQYKGGAVHLDWPHMAANPCQVQWMHGVAGTSRLAIEERTANQGQAHFLYAILALKFTRSKKLEI